MVFSHGMHRMLGGAAVSAAPTKQRCTAHRTHLGGYGIPAIPTPPAMIVFSHRWHRSTQMVRLRSIVPRNTQNTQKFSSARKFCEFCGSTFQQEASVCSVNSVGRCSGCSVGALLALLVHLRQVHPLELHSLEGSVGMAGCHTLLQLHRLGGCPKISVRICDICGRISQQEVSVNSVNSVGR